MIQKTVFALLFFCATSAMADCKGFVHVEPGRQPASVDCGAKAKDMAQCQKFCRKAAQKKCTQKGEMQVDVNFHSPTDGMAVDSLHVSCK